MRETLREFKNMFVLLYKGSINFFRRFFFFGEFLKLCISENGNVTKDPYLLEVPTGDFDTTF